MKFNLTINDIEVTELDKVINALNVLNGSNELCNVAVSKNDIVLTDEPIVPVEADFEQPAPFEPAYDKNGLPWDARIHSSNHKMTDKGVWQRRRGISDIEFESVKNELLGLTAPVEPVQPQVTVTEPVAPVVAPTPTPVAPVVAPVTLAVDNSFTPQVIAPAPTPVVAPAQPTVDANVLFQTMFEKIKAGMAAGLVKANDVQNLVNAVNAQFGTQYQALASVKDNVDVLQFIINDLTTRGL